MFCVDGFSFAGKYLDEANILMMAAQLQYHGFITGLACPERADGDKLPVIFSWQDSVIAIIFPGNQSFNHHLLRNYPILPMYSIYTYIFILYIKFQFLEKHQVLFRLLRNMILEVMRLAIRDMLPTQRCVYGNHRHGIPCLMADG